MNFETLHALELPWIKKLQLLGNPLIDYFFMGLNLFDRMEFYFILIPLVWYLISPRWGIRIFYLMVISLLTNSFLKLLFQEPRPSQLDPSLALITFNTYGFPSGGAQNAVIIATLLIKEWKNSYRYLAGFLFFFLISLSRIYLGAHFFTDVIAGWLIGAFLITLFYFTYRPIESFIRKQSDEVTLSLAIAFFLSFLFIAPNDPTSRTAFTAIGGSIGLFLANRYLPYWPIGNNRLRQVLQALALTLLVFVIYAISILWLAKAFPAHQFAFKSVAFLLIGLTSTFLAPALFLKTSFLSSLYILNTETAEITEEKREVKNSKDSK